MGAASDDRQLAGLSRLNVLARELIDDQPFHGLLTRVVDAAKELTRADFSALLILRTGTDAEVAHFTYNAPRDLFPERLPRAVGLLAEPIHKRAPVRVDEICHHPHGVGIPTEHPPIAALLAVPILSADQVLGEVAVANRPGRPAFDDVDEALVQELAAHAGVAVTLATLRRTQEEAEERREALLDVALHDIRTPLTVARGFLSTIRSYGSELSAEDLESSFDSIDQALGRIQRLAEGPLVGRSDPSAEGAARRPAEAVDVHELFSELRCELGDYRQDVNVEVAVEPGWASTFMSDRALVREVLDNLVTNALKHSPPGEVVRVTARPEGESIRFDVTDRGHGIAPEEQGRVFERGYRTRQSQVAGVAGTGQGLSIVQRLAQLQGGAIGLSSRRGDGTTFWATFPLEPAPGPAGTGTASGL